MNNVIELRPQKTQPQNDIQMFFHCKKCGEETPDDMPRCDYQQLEVGWTEQGLQVWCRRHDMNIIHIDFEGHCHPAE